MAVPSTCCVIRCATEPTEVERHVGLDPSGHVNVEAMFARGGYETLASANVPPAALDTSATGRPRMYGEKRSIVSWLISWVRFEYDNDRSAGACHVSTIVVEPPAVMLTFACCVQASVAPAVVFARTSMSCVAAAQPIGSTSEADVMLPMSSVPQRVWIW